MYATFQRFKNFAGTGPIQNLETFWKDRVKLNEINNEI